MLMVDLQVVELLMFARRSLIFSSVFIEKGCLLESGSFTGDIFLTA
jgi:hypothetical protein